MLSYRHGVLAACLCLHACGGGGTGSGNSGTGQATYGRISLLSTTPADGDVQVALQARIVMRFDAAMVIDCMRDEDTVLRRVGTTTPIAGEYSLLEGGTAVGFTPAAPLQAETDYEFVLSPLTCDQSGRLLEVEHRFGFRTLDTTAPAVVACNVFAGETNRSRTAPLVVTTTETLAAASITSTTVVLRDVFGQRYPCTRDVAGTALTVTPSVDLPGDRLMTLQLAATVTDRAGNALGQSWAVQFRTAADLTPPSALSLWPTSGSSGVSPQVQPIVTFDESMDPTTVEPASLLFQDDFGSIVAFAVVASTDQKTLRVRPLAPLQANRHYVLAFLVSAAAVTDVSGNGLASTLALSFDTGSDSTAPQLVGTLPSDGQTRVSINTAPVITFDGGLDAAWVGDDTVQLLSAGAVVPAVVDQPTAASIRITPVLPLEPSATYTVRLAGGHAGIRDLAGNVLAADQQFTFTAAADGTLPGATVQPADGAVNVPLGARVSIVFDSIVDPATVVADNFQLRSDAGSPLAATVALGQGGRVVTIVPLAGLQPNTYYRTFIRGGTDGVREYSGNALAADVGARFRTGTAIDIAAPAVTATINALDPTRRTGIVLPQSGFTIDVNATDGSQVPDMGNVTVELSGPPGSTPPTSAQLATDATFGFRTYRALVPATTPLAVGTWTATVRVADLSGNVGSAAPITFTVAAPDGGTVPFERTQVVWARTDLDRDGNGRTDWDDDLVRLGLATVGDPRGTNAFVSRTLLDATLAAANQLYGRGPRGEPIDVDSVAIRFTTHQPIGIGHLQIALGGFDPEGQRGRGYGDDSTGVLGRAFFDARNANMNDRDIATSPGLGVFPAEMFLYQAEIHRQVYPSFQTMWAQRFLPLSPALGGTPAGSHTVDGTVLNANFDPNTGTSEQRARWLVVMRAIDDWAVVIGTVLAHEVGHSVGLVAPGPAPSGLFGDASLHDANAGAAEVMAPSVGYEAMLTLTYSFRDVNLAYLRHRILQR